MERTNKDNLIKGSIWNFVGTFLRLGIGIFGSIVFVRYLGKEGYGISVYITDAALFIVVIASLGLGTLQAKLLPELRTKKENAKYKYLIIHNLRIRIGVLIGLLLTATIIKELNVTTAFDLVRDYYHFFIIYSVLQIVLAVLRGPLQQEYEQRFVNLTEVYALVGRIVLVLPVIHWDMGLVGFLWTEVVVEVVQLIFLATKFYFKILKGLRGIPVEKYNGELLSASIIIFLVDLSSPFLGKELDVILLGVFLGKEAFAGIAAYSLSFILVLRAFSFLGLGTAYTATLLMSYTSDLVSAGKIAKVPILIEKQLKMLMIIVIPMTVGGIILGGAMLKVMYGEALAGNGWIIGWLFWGFGLSSISYISKPLLLTLGRGKAILISRIVIALSKIAVCILVVPHLGTHGLCIVTAVALSGVSIGELIILNSNFRIRIPMKFALKVILSSFIMALLVCGLTTLVDVESLPWLILTMGVGGISYVSLMYAFKPLDFSDVELLNDFTMNSKNARKLIGIFAIHS